MLFPRGQTGFLENPGMESRYLTPRCIWYQDFSSSGAESTVIDITDEFMKYDFIYNGMRADSDNTARVMFNFKTMGLDPWVLFTTKSAAWDGLQVGPPVVVNWDPATGSNNVEFSYNQGVSGMVSGVTEFFSKAANNHPDPATGTFYGLHRSVSGDAAVPTHGSASVGLSKRVSQVRFLMATSGSPITPIPITQGELMIWGWPRPVALNIV